MILSVNVFANEPDVMGESILTGEIEEVSSENMEKLTKELIKYQKKEKKQKLTKTEVYKIAKDFGIENLTLYSEEELLAFEKANGISSIAEKSDTISMLGIPDIDVCDYFVAEIENSGSVYGIAMGIRNMDLLDVHDSYTGQAIGYTEVSPGAEIFYNPVNHVYQEFNVHPGMCPVDFVYVGKPGPTGKAFFYVSLFAYDDNVLMKTPYFRKWQSW